MGSKQKCVWCIFLEHWSSQRRSSAKTRQLYQQNTILFEVSFICSENTHSLSLSCADFTHTHTQTDRLVGSVQACLFFFSPRSIDLFVAVGSSVQIPCIDGEEKGVEWKFNNSVLSLSPVLSIKNISLQDQGIYTCHQPNGDPIQRVFLHLGCRFTNFCLYLTPCVYEHNHIAENRWLGQKRSACDVESLKWNFTLCYVCFIQILLLLQMCTVGLQVTLKGQYAPGHWIQILYFRHITLLHIGTAHYAVKWIVLWYDK